jgi:ribonuclease P protein component
MLAKRNRLPVRLFNKKNAERIATPYFVLWRLKNNLDHSYNRFAIVVANRIEKTAVGRHRVRRILAECARTLPGMGYDTMVVMTEGGRGAGSRELCSALQESFAKHK